MGIAIEWRHTLSQIGTQSAFYELVSGEGGGGWEVVGHCVSNMVGIQCRC